MPPPDLTACPRCDRSAYIVSADDWICRDCEFYILYDMEQEYQFPLGPYYLVVDVEANETVIYAEENRFETYLGTLEGVLLDPKFDDVSWIEKCLLLR